MLLSAFGFSGGAAAFLTGTGAGAGAGAGAGEDAGAATSVFGIEAVG